TLGIITRVVLRLFPKPRSTMAALCAVADYPAVLALLDAARGGLGPLLSAFEVMWPDYWQVITERAGVRSPVGSGHGLYVLVEAQPKEEMDGIIYGLVRDMGGSVSAEHGIGTMKKKWLGHARSEPEIALMRLLKVALDPKGLLNPGKVI